MARPEARSTRFRQSWGRACRGARWIVRHVHGPVRADRDPAQPGRPRDGAHHLDRIVSRIIHREAPAHATQEVLPVLVHRARPPGSVRLEPRLRDLADLPSREIDHEGREERPVGHGPERDQHSRRILCRPFRHRRPSDTTHALHDAKSLDFGLRRGVEGVLCDGGGLLRHEECEACDQDGSDGHMHHHGSFSSHDALLAEGLLSVCMGTARSGEAHAVSFVYWAKSEAIASLLRRHGCLATDSIHRDSGTFT